MSLINADVYTTEGRRIGRVLVEREFLTVGRHVSFLRRRHITVRVEDLPHIAEPLHLVTAYVERMHGAPGRAHSAAVTRRLLRDDRVYKVDILRTSDPVEHWTEVKGFQKANIHALQLTP